MNSLGNFSFLPDYGPLPHFTRAPLILKHPTSTSFTHSWKAMIVFMLFCCSKGGVHICKKRLSISISFVFSSHEYFASNRIPHFTLTDRLIIPASTGLAVEVLPLMLVTIPSGHLWSLSSKSTFFTDQGDMTSQKSTTCSLPFALHSHSLVSVSM